MEEKESGESRRQRRRRGEKWERRSERRKKEGGRGILKLSGCLGEYLTINLPNHLVRPASMINIFCNTYLFTFYIVHFLLVNLPYEPTL